MDRPWQPLEVRPYDQGGLAAPTTTHLLGQRVFGQIGTSSGTLRFLHADGHGSTRLLSDAAAAVAAAFGYDAFGSPLGFDPAAAGTIYLFGGDGVYDAASGLTLHCNGVRARSDFLFLQRDPYAGDRQDPLSLHKYLYVHANPVTYTDPSGYMTLVGWIGVALGIAATTIGVYSCYDYMAPGRRAAANNPLLPDDRRLAAAGQLRAHLGTHSNVQNLIQELEQGASGIEIRVMPAGEGGVGHRMGNIILVSESIVTGDDLYLGLVIFCEFQHTGYGGRLTEPEAQRELDEVRGMLQPRFRSKKIDGLHHED